MPRAGHLFGAGLAAMGIDPARIILVCESHPLRAVAATEEALAAQGVAAVICEYSALAKKSDLWMKAARRLQLAAEQGGTTGLMLGPPAAAAGFETRWYITPASQRVDEMVSAGEHVSAIKHKFDWQPCWQIELMHCRGGHPAETTTCWDIRSARFRPAAASPVLSLTSSSAKFVSNRAYSHQTYSGAIHSGVTHFDQPQTVRAFAGQSAGEKYPRRHTRQLHQTG